MLPWRHSNSRAFSKRVLQVKLRDPCRVLAEVEDPDAGLGVGYIYRVKRLLYCHVLPVPGNEFRCEVRRGCDPCIDPLGGSAIAALGGIGQVGSRLVPSRLGFPSIVV